MTPAFRTLALLAAAAAMAACEPASDAAFGKRVRAYLLEHPEVIREAAQKLAENEEKAAVQAASNALSGARARLEQDKRDFVANPGGKITVVEFFDYRCGYCKVTAPQILKLIADNPDVRFVFKEMPIFGDVSDTAARVALTPAGKAKGLQLYRLLMAEKNLTEAALDRHLVSLGIDPAAAREAAKSPEITDQISDSLTLAQDLKIEGTPAFVVGDTLIPGADLDALHAAIIKAKASKKG